MSVQTNYTNKQNRVKERADVGTKKNVLKTNNRWEKKQRENGFAATLY